MNNNTLHIKLPPGLRPGRQYRCYINDCYEVIVLQDQQPLFADAPYSPPNPVQCDHTATAWNVSFTSGGCRLCGLRFSNFDHWNGTRTVHERQ